jgi:DNA end-binding protein Ku
MAARAIGSGTVSFGLVSIPVKIFTTNKTTSHVSFKMVHASCGSRVKQQYICPTDEEVVPRSDMAKGYEFAKGQYVVFSNDEIKAVEAVSNNQIELAEFVPEDQIDPVYVDKHYYLGPDKGGERAYKLLNQAMTDTGLVGLAKYSARGKQYLVLVRPYNENGLIMHQLRFSDEIRSFDEVPFEEAPEVSEAELKLAIQIIEQIANEEFSPENYKDEVKERVLELIQKKIDGEEITAAPEAPQAQIINLMDALKQSLGQGDGAKKASGSSKKKKTASSSKKSSAKSTAKKKSTTRKGPKSVAAKKKSSTKSAKSKKKAEG